MAGTESDSAGSTIEQTYQKKTQLEHILLRPDTYVGSLDFQDSKMWVWSEAEQRMVTRSVSFVPGLYKIFDEILVNAADNYQRDKTMSRIEVTIDRQLKSISVWNNGKGIPVVIHGEYDIYVPELIFGHLLTSSNYDDSKKKVTGGRNGYGAKLTNVFSTKFIVETADSERMKQFRMEWRNNMHDKSSPQIVALKKKEDYTCVTFFPDLRRLKMTELDDDIFDIMVKRVYDLAGCTSQRVKVWLNGKEIKVRNFEEYIRLYTKGEEQDIVYRSFGGRWEVGFTVSDGVFQQVSFVNCICTIKGGTHVNYIAEQLTDAINGVLQKKHKKHEVKPAHIKQHMWLFVNSLIENPAFDSQTKETLTLKASQFGSACELDEAFVKSVLTSGIVESIVAFADAKTSAQLAKKVKGKKTEKLTIPKLEDANDAGSKHARDCTLILTEGDSAKSLVMSGFDVIGRDRYGVFPLKGKLLNVREASPKQLMENEEIQNIMKIMGLQPKRVYENIEDLRYGTMMVMTDQDLDGSHIKGLIVNFIHFFWPSLLKVNGFLKEFITPIVKATNKRSKEVVSFFTQREFESWLEHENPSHWITKYYKGLGTSTNKEAKEYFGDLPKHRLRFVWRQDREDADAIELAFSKKRADDRKKWLEDMDPDVFLDMQGDIQYSDFINKELILFSQYDNIRSIPSMVDGMKPGQRKILFCCFKRNLVNELKVAQLSGYVAEKSAYHHGEISLAQTIVGLAQNFVGSNNINLLQPIGQFGTRLSGGKDSANSRYIFTALSPITRFLFPEEDDALLTYLDEEGLRIEPHWYVPIIPTVLVNGAEGIGTGWSTNVPQFNPFDLIEAIKARIRGVAFEDTPLTPWYRGFTGPIEKSGQNYEVLGIFTRNGAEIVEVSELPIKKWNSDYKLFLESQRQGEEPFIADFRDGGTEKKIHYEVKIPTLTELTDKELVKKLKLSTSISMGNMVLFNAERRIKKYEKVSEIMEEHFIVRKEYYEKRKDYLVRKLDFECQTLSNKVRFILMVISGELIINLKQKKELCQELKRKGFTAGSMLKKIFQDVKMVEEDGNNQEQAAPAVAVPAAADDTAADFNYLLSMPLWSLTHEEVERLKQEKATRLEELDVLQSTTVYSLWERDLDKLKATIELVWKAEAEDDKCEVRKPLKRKAMAAPAKRVKKEKENPPAKPAALKQTSIQPHISQPLVQTSPVVSQPPVVPQTLAAPKPQLSVFDQMRAGVPGLQKKPTTDSSDSDFANPFKVAAGRSRIRKAPGESLPKQSSVIEVLSSDSEFEA